MSTLLGIDYQTWWFMLIGAVFTGYIILDGFDLGAGALHLFFNKEQSRRIVLNAIGPVWDGNEVWIVIGGGVSLVGEQLLFEPLRKRVAARVFEPFAGCYDIVPAALGEEVVLHGALALAERRFR